MKYRHLFILITAATVLFACNGKEDPQPKPDPEDTSFVTLSLKSLDLAPDEGSTASVDVITEDAWTLEGMSEGVREWLSVDAEQGTGNATLTFSSLGFNPYNETRMAVLTVRSGKASARVIVKQANDPERVITLSEEALAFTGAAGQELTVNVETTKPWELDGYTDEMKEWLSVEPVSGETNATVTLKVLNDNMDIADRVAQLGFRIDRVHCAKLNVSQTTSLTIRASDSVVPDFPFDKPSEAQVIILTNTDKYPWHVEGLTAEVKTWLSVTPESATGLETTVTIKTLTANESVNPRTATLTFCLSEKVACSVTVTQKPEALQTIVITWKAGGNKTDSTVKGGEMSPHSKFPWVDGWTTLGDVNREWKNGYNGEVVKKGKYDVTATWLFQDYVTKEWVPFEMGPIRTDATTGIYYQQQESTNVRWAWSYIKIPARAGYRITHIKMTSINSASNATLVFGTDKTARNGFLEESAARVTFGKENPLDKEFNSTEPNTDYYLGSILDRTFDSFEFTYTEVR